MGNVCVIFALKRERRAFHDHFPITHQLTNTPCWAALCGPQNFLVLQTGVGAERMQTAMDWLFNNTDPPRLIVSAGYAGALHDELRVGDTFLASDVVDHDASAWPVPWPADTSYRRGRLVTARHFVPTPAAKRELASKHQALIVDMETAVIARACAARNIPFACLRTVSDAVEPALSPQIVHLLSNGRVPVVRLAWAIVRRPRLVPELWRLARQTRLASHRLGLALRDLLPAAARDHESGTETQNGA